MRNTGHSTRSPDTDRGVIVIEFYPAVAPKTVANFETLAKKGFYNGLTFHRVVPGFVVQGGDPKGDGSGGPGYDVPAEISPGRKASARLGRDGAPGRRGQSRIASPAAASSISASNRQPGLDGQYTVFGGVIEGMAVVDKIQVGDHMKKVTLASEAPK